MFNSSKNVLIRICRPYLSNNFLYLIFKSIIEIETKNIQFILSETVSDNIYRPYLSGQF